MYRFKSYALRHRGLARIGSSKHLAPQLKAADERVTARNMKMYRGVAHVGE